MSMTSRGAILVVDDEKEICTLLERALARFSYQVITAASGEQALDIIKSNDNIHLVLSDIRMPKTTGIDLLRETRKIKPELPIVLMTGYGGVDQYFEVMNMGASEYLTKPFKIYDLIRAIKTALKVPCSTS